MEGTIRVRRLWWSVSLGLIIACPSAASSDQVKFYDQTGKHAGTYLCLPVAIGGVAWDDHLHEWNGTRFRVPNRKLIVVVKTNKLRKIGKAIDGDPAMGYIVTLRESESKSDKRCEGDFRETHDGVMNDVFISRFGIMSCADPINQMTINFETGRYMSIYPIGYIGGSNSGEDTPSIEIGTCTVIQ